MTVHDHHLVLICFHVLTLQGLSTNRRNYALTFKLITLRKILYHSGTILVHNKHLNMMFKSHYSLLFLTLSQIFLILIVQAGPIISGSISQLKSIKPTGTKKIRSRQNLALSGESCISNLDCFNQDCIRSGAIPCEGSFDCICSLPACTTNSDCLIGETCAQVSDEKRCLSRNSRLNEREGGLTLSTCKTLEDCATYRDCYVTNNGNKTELCSSNSISCKCFPLKVDICSTSGSTVGCDTKGEVCTKLDEDVNACAVPNSLSSTPPENPEATGGDKSGLTFETCREDSYCAGDRKCVYGKDGNLEYCDQSHSVCLCSPNILERCEIPANCSVDGETCVEFTSLSKSYCVSKVVAPMIEEHEQGKGIDGTSGKNCGGSPLEKYTTCADTVPQPGTPPITSTPSPIVVPNSCVDAKALSHLPTEKLVFETHRYAVVLCDIHGSCATGGHMVHYQGLAMMMRTYCGIVRDGCKEEIMQVNSPKWQKQLRIRSKSAEMEYLAFAAKYETKAEEIILRKIIHMGL